MYFAIIRSYHFINLFNLSVSNSDPKGKKKNPSCCQYSAWYREICQCHQLSFYDYANRERGFLRAVTHRLRRRHTAQEAKLSAKEQPRHQKSVTSKYRAQEIVVLSTSLSRGRQRGSVNVFFACNFCVCLCRKYKGLDLCHLLHINDSIYDRE